MYVGRHVYASACACVWSQKTRLGIISPVHHCLTFETGSSIHPEFAHEVRLACQQASGINLSLPQALGLQVHATMLSYFVWALGTKSDPCSS